MIKVDFHTHSVHSPDGSLSEVDYSKLLGEKTLDCIAITDHDVIDFAIQMHKKHGDKIIVGQEITTNQGEIIGLFLKKLVKPNTELKIAVQEVLDQDGLIYIPHPFETIRKGLSKKALNSIAKDVSVIEAHNGRAFFQNKGPEATVWARLNNKVVASSSDAHGVKGIGTSYTNIAKIPTKENLVELLRKGRLETKRPPLSSLLYPKYNRLRGKLNSVKNKI